jgi:hypothetical protein
MNYDDLRLAEKYLRLSESARAREIPFTLTFAQFKRLYQRERCTYSGVVLTSEQGPEQATMDRICAAGPYSVENCVVCCRASNSHKGGMTAKEILAVARMIRRRKL